MEQDSSEVYGEDEELSLSFLFFFAVMINGIWFFSRGRDKKHRDRNKKYIDERK